MQYTFFVGQRKLYHCCWALWEMSSLSLSFALTHPVSITVFTLLVSAAIISFPANTSTTASWNSYDISLLSSKDRSLLPSHGRRGTEGEVLSFFLLSTSLFTELLSHEKLNWKSFLSSQERGKSLQDSLLGIYSAANFDIIGHPGYQSHIIFATLSKASQAASSWVVQILLTLHISCIWNKSLCPPETLRQISGNSISDSSLSRKFENICASMWLISITGIENIFHSVRATVIPVSNDGISPGWVVTQI